VPTLSLPKISPSCLILTDCNKFQGQANAYCILHNDSELLAHLRASHLPRAWRTTGWYPPGTSEKPPSRPLTRLLEKSHPASCGEDNDNDTTPWAERHSPSDRRPSILLPLSFKLRVIIYRVICLPVAANCTYVAVPICLSNTTIN
jgi:hypothetical protein